MTPADIRELRLRLALSQHAFSNLLGVRRETIIRWEREGGPRPQPGHLRKLEELASSTIDTSVPEALEVR